MLDKRHDRSVVQGREPDEVSIAVEVIVILTVLEWRTQTDRKFC